MVWVLKPETLEALLSPTRVRILKLLRDRNMTLSEISRSLDMSKSTVSEHIEKLLNAGLVAKNRRSKWVYVSLTEFGRKVVDGDELFVKIILSIGVALFVGGICEIYRYLTRPKITVILDSTTPPQQTMEETTYFTIINNLFGPGHDICGALLTFIALKKHEQTKLSRKSSF
ncbi:winged helix-turn-helix domain-containing protein [Archaeoglobus fulgidus]|jgi:DNA-binding transcriptional ArsR family regulator|nr:winged helix-turn-helix domain-containing protein [Archaeoglobus fulgidus]AIG99123.1 putative transcriptional regulator [Archaeoglobus fulgidus DSM 8774]KUJ94182.1 MAG: Transcriptional regulatory protein, ArsR family [Archaeoglobus fulgidus]KUK05751.1 MAG: Transcriptional regulatory protein, ArsR family [Archaeoglobus fulgidus]